MGLRHNVVTESLSLQSPRPSTRRLFKLDEVLNTKRRRSSSTRAIRALRTRCLTLVGGWSAKPLADTVKTPWKQSETPSHSFFLSMFLNIPTGIFINVGPPSLQHAPPGCESSSRNHDCVFWIPPVVYTTPTRKSRLQVAVIVYLGRCALHYSATGGALQPDRMLIWNHPPRHSARSFRSTC